MALLAGIGYRGFVVPNSKLRLAPRSRSSSTRGWFPRIPADISAVRPPSLAASTHAPRSSNSSAMSFRANCVATQSGCTSAATARIDVSAPVEERLDEFPLSSPHRDEERGFSFRHVVHGHTGIEVPENGGTPAVVQRVLHVGVGVLLGTGGRKAPGNPPNRNRKERSSGCDRFLSWSAC
jgi:hypothetical protein